MNIGEWSLLTGFVISVIILWELGKYLINRLEERLKRSGLNERKD